MIVNPGIRRFLGSAIQRLFNSASFSAPLTHSLVLERGTGSPSFTRATTATGQKWDEAGYLDFTALAGEAVFKGARRERNLLSATQAMSAAPWAAVVTGIATVTPTDGQSDPWGGTTAAKIVFSASNNTDVSVWRQAVSVTLGDTHMSQLYIRADVPTTLYLRRGASASFVTLNVTTEWQSLHGAAVVAASTTCNFDLTPKPDAITGTAGATVYVVGAQLSNTTGETDQTTIRPYVSVGVESAPAYHGSMVDGVKCFPTDLSGNPIPSTTMLGYQAEGARTNLCLQSNAFTTTWTALGTPAATQNLVGPDGGTTGWTVTDNDAGAAEGLLQTYGALTAANYAQSIFIKKTLGAASFPVIRLNEPVSPKEALCTVDTNNGIATVWTAYTGSTIVTSSASCVSHNADWWRVTLVFAATTASWRIIFYPAGTANATQATGTVSAAVTGTCGIYGAQVELGSFATPYIPTTTLAAARNADVDQYPTTAGPIAAVGAISLDFTPYHAPSGTIALWGTYVDASNYTAILHDATNLIFRKRIAGSNYDATIANAFASGTTYKVAATWGTSGTAIYLDGVAGTPHANTTAAQIAATMQVGADGNSLQQPGAGTTNLRIWQRQLSAPEGVAVTS